MKEHTGHDYDYDVLTGVACKRKTELCSEADSLLAVQAKLEDGIAHIRAEEEGWWRQSASRWTPLGRTLWGWWRRCRFPRKIAVSLLS